MSNVHTYPTRDFIDHDTNTLDDCPCGPSVEFLEGGAHVVHHSLDGREHQEPDHNRKECPGCRARNE